MDVEKIKTSLDAAVMQSFGDMAFIDVVSTEPQAVDHGQIMILEITKPTRGEIYLIMSKEGKQQAVENIHGDSWDQLTPAQIDDCLLELLNVLGGNFLSDYYGENVSYSLSFPQVIFDESELPDLNEFVKFTYDAEDVPFSVAIKLDLEGAHA